MLSFKVNSKHKILKASEVHPHPLNEEVYGDITVRNKEHILDVATQIHKNGLHNPIEVYYGSYPKGTKKRYLIITGHHRYQGIVEHLQSKFVPVVILDEIDERESILLDRMTSDNMRGQREEVDYLREVEASIKIYKRDGVKVTKEIEKEIYSKHSWSANKMDMYRQLKNGYTVSKGQYKGLKIAPRLNLLKDDFQTGKRKLKELHTMQRKDAILNFNNKQRPYIKSQSKYISKDIGKVALKEVQKAMLHIMSNSLLKLTFENENATSSTVMSNALTHSITEQLKAGGIDATAPNNNAHFDIIAEPNSITKNKKIEWEVKVTMGENSDLRWTSGQPKIGWNILMATDKQFKNFFLALAYVPEYNKKGEKVWKGWDAGIGTFQLRTQSLKNSDCMSVKVLHGKLTSAGKVQKTAI